MVNHISRHNISMSEFWTNTVWYIALGATSAVSIIIMFIRSKVRKKLFAFWFGVLGFTYMLEACLVLLFNAYTYHPMMRPEDPFFDAVLGNIFSQVSVSSSAVLICVLGLSNWWLAGFSAAYFMIDVLYVHLGVYEHFWYQSVFTLGGFFLYGLIVKWWYKRMVSGFAKWLYYATLFLSVFAVTTNIVGTALKLLNLRVFQASFYSDLSKNHTVVVLIYGYVLIIIMIALYKWKSPWWQKAFVFLLLLVCQWGLLQSGVIIVRPGWGIFIMLFDLILFFGWTVIMDRYLQGKSKQCQSPWNGVASPFLAHTNVRHGKR